MSVSFGNVSIKDMYYGSTKIGEAYLGSTKVYESGTSPSPSLPPYTIRLKYKQGTTPTFSYGTGVLVDATNNIWDLTYEDPNWFGLLQEHFDLLEVIDANTTNVTNMITMFMSCTSLRRTSLFDTSNVTDMNSMFLACSSLPNVPLFDTTNVTSMNSMFQYCNSLTSVPLFNTSNLIDMSTMFYECYNVQSGALALYQQVSTQTNIPYHGEAFRDCGRDTTTGAAELAQIPDDWK